MGQEAAANVAIVDDAVDARAPPPRGRRAGPARPRRPATPRPPAARGDDAPGRRRQALLSEEPAPARRGAARAREPGRPRALRAPRIDFTPLREAPPFRWFWLGQAAKDLGGGIAQVALPFQIYQLTGSTLAVAAISFVELVPLVTLTLLGGALADAVDRRRLLIWTQIGMAATGVGLVVNAALPNPQVWACFVLAFFSASFFCLGVGGMRSITPRLVAPEQLTAALVLESISSSFASVGGPALGGVLIGSVGLTATYAIDLVDVRRRDREHLRAARRSRPSPTPTGRACGRSPTASATSSRSPSCSASCSSTSTRWSSACRWRSSRRSRRTSTATRRSSATSTPRRTPVRSSRRSRPAGSRTCAGRGSRS